MLRDKKLSINRTYRNKTCNYHFINLLHNHKNKQNKQIDGGDDFIQEKHDHPKHSSPLGQKLIQQNFIKKQEEKNNRKDQINFQAESFDFMDLYSKEKGKDKDKEKEKIYMKISELIKNEELCLAKKSEDNNKLQIRPKPRPYTSLSQKKYLPERRESLARYSYVLCIPPKQRQQQVNESSKISTSRALIQYSKVYKKESIQKIRRKKDKINSNNFLQLSTHKIHVFEKQKPMKDRRSYNSLNKTSLMNLSSNKKIKKFNRYDQEDIQTFEIGAWDYFQ